MPTYRDWVKNIDIEVDYYSAFIKAWIAFNSWYNAVINEKTDRATIEKIKTTSNLFRQYAQNFLKSNEQDGKTFQDDLGRLHRALTNAAIVTQECAGIQKQITFAEISFKNPKKKVNEQYRNTQYCLERKGSEIIINLSHKTNGISFFSYRQDTYDESDLVRHPDYMKESAEKQGQCLAHYKSICPFTTESILSVGGNDQDSLTFSEVNFVRNTETISIALIEVLYLLRCALMHGEVFPDKNSHEVYRYAYQLLAAVMKKLV